MKFKRQLNCEPNNKSLAEIGYLYTIVGEAIEIIADLQTHQRDPHASKMLPDPHWDEQKYQLNLIAQEVYLALTGNKISKDGTKILVKK